MRIIAVHGKKEAGKDELYKTVQSIEGDKVDRLSLADALKDEVAIVLANEYINQVSPRWYDHYERIRAELDNPLTKAKYRLLLQCWGTEVKRVLWTDDYWLKAWDRGSEDLYTDTIFCCDVRFPNEYEFFKAKGAHMVKVVRPVIKRTDEHISETALDYLPDSAWDAVLVNGGTLEDYQAIVVRFWNELRGNNA